MALNFPNSPSVGDIYEDSTSGFSYQWDGTFWKSYKVNTNSLGGNLDAELNLNSNDITGTGDVDTTGNLKVSGIATASSFVKSSGTSSQFLKADGSVDSSTYITASDNITGTSGGLTGSPSITVTDITASGDVSIGGTLTYQDVTNIDSVGLITARSGIHVTGVGSSVGIGTDDPESALHVTGAIPNSPTKQGVHIGAHSGYGIMQFTAATGGFIDFGESGVDSAGRIIYTHSDDTLKFQTANAVAATIDGSGRLGINETALSSFNSIADDLVISQASDSAGITIRSSTSGSGTLAFTDGENTLFRGDIRYVHNGDYMRFTTDGDERVRILSDGTVATGGLTATPATVAAGSYIQHAANAGFFGNNGDAKFGSSANNPVLLQVNGSEKVRIDTSGRLLLGTSNAVAFGSRQVLAVTNGTTGGVLSLYNSTTATDNTRISSNPTGSEINDIGIHAASTNGSIQFYTNNDTERMRIQSDGTVLLGNSSTTINYIANYNQAAKMHLSGAGGGSGNIEIYGTNHATLPKTITFNTNSAERMRIRSDGHVLIGTTTFAASGGLTLRYDGYIVAPSIYSLTLTSSPRDIYMDSNGYFGYITSVRESKSNIQLQDNVDWLYQLEPVTFNYKTRDRETGEYTGDVESELEYGLIAEDVETVCPDLCFYDETDDSPELRGVSYKKLITPMLKALQDAKAEIDTLKAKVAALENG